MKSLFFTYNLENLKFFVSIIMVISLPLSGSLKIISLFSLLVILLIQLYKKEITLNLSAIHYGFIFLFLSALLSSIFASDSVKSLKGARDIFYFTIPFFIAQSINHEKRIKTILWSLYISTAVAVSFGIIYSIQAQRPLEIHSLGNQNYTAMYLMTVLTAMISTIIFSDKETKDLKTILIMLTFLIAVGAVMTAMRTSFLALFLFVAILFFRYKQLKSVKLISFALLGSIVTAIFLYRPMWVKLTNTQSLISRVSIWQHAIDIFNEHPITGIGLNHFIFKFPANHPVEPNTILYDAHSIYFQILSQMGILGLASLFLIVIGLLNKLLKFEAISGFEKTLKYSAMGGFLVTFVGGIFDTTLHHEHAIAFTLLTGLMVGLLPRKEKFHDNTT
ncbi:MAG: O-antigen ligase family protein [Nitrospirae bacterium]|nr:O-antigen ligase family protein [Nitrospirota bacterium]